jgi:hypothetical protein
MSWPLTLPNFTYVRNHPNEAYSAHLNADGDVILAVQGRDADQPESKIILELDEVEYLYRKLEELRYQALDFKENLRNNGD